MKKKLALFCMAGVMVFGTAACGSRKTDTDAPETGEAARTEADGTPSAGADRVGSREDYVGIQDLDIEEYVTLADYKNMKVSAVRPEVDDEDIERYVNSAILTGYITDRAVEDGDVVDIDYVGKKDGEAFPGGSAQGYQLMIGSGVFIPGFEEGLVGVMPGETVDLNLAFPEDYRRNAELAGQEVVFTVTVNGIEASVTYADATAADMERLGLEYRTKEEVWEAGKNAVEDNADKTFAANAEKAVVQKLVEDSTAKLIPDYLVEEEVQNYNIYMESIAALYGVDLETFVTQASGMTMEAYRADLTEICSSTVKEYLVAEAVARAEGIVVTEDMINEKAAVEAEEYGYESAEALIDEVGYTTYRMSIVQEKVLARLMEIVTVEEEGAE